MRVVLDYESRSACDLKKAGAIKYAQHESTDIICVSWKIENGLTHVWFPMWEPVPSEFKKAIKNKAYTLVAHNAGFEQAITEWCLFPKYFDSLEYREFLTPERWRCTAAKAAAHALPRNLEDACIALDLPVKKDMEGRKLILKYCKPRRASKKNSDMWWQDPADFKRLGEYCKTDVEAEYLLDKRLRDLNQVEQKIWFLDQKINQRGISVDLCSVNKALVMLDLEKTLDAKRVYEITNGAINSANQRAKILDFVNERGAGLPDLKAGTVKAALSWEHVEGEVREIIEIRQRSSKSSTAKFQAFEARTCEDGRLRDNLMYHGASTGRFSSTGVQLQNLAKSKIKDVDGAIEILKSGDNALMRLEYGDVMTALSACLRGMLVASPNKTLYCADYSAIEARVLPWLAGDEETIEIFKTGGDLYIEMAADIFGKPKSEISKDERQLGKISILGLGFSMGKKKFYETCAAWGCPVSEELAAKAVNTYRERFHLVVSMWRNIERAAMEAVKFGRSIKINRVTWFVRDDFLHCKLPSGRLLSYYKPRIVTKTNAWGGEGPELRFMAQNSMTRQFEETGVYGGLLVENCVQAVARDIMAEAMLRIENAGYEILVSVHDELLAEHKKGDLTEYVKLMTTIPVWAKGLPIDSTGWVGKKYKK